MILAHWFNDNFPGESVLAEGFPMIVKVVDASGIFVWLNALPDASLGKLFTVRRSFFTY